MKQRAIIFGAGNNFIYSARVLLDAVEVVAIADNDSSKWGQEYFGYQVYSLEDALHEEYDLMVVTPTYYEPIIEDLKLRGVPDECLIAMDDVLARGFETRKLTRGTNQQLHIAVLLYGGLGDFIVSKIWLHYLHEKYGVSYTAVDLYVHRKDVMSVQSVYRDVVMDDQIHAIDVQNPNLLPEENYDVVVWLNMVPAIVAWDELLLQHKNAVLYEYIKRLETYGREHYKSNLFASQSYYKVIKRFRGKRYIQFADVFNEFTIDDEFPGAYPLDENNYLREHGLREKRYITLNTGLNREYDKKKNVRAWDIENWKSLAKQLKVNCSEYMIVQLGQSVDAKDIGADVNLSGQTDMEQIKTVLKNAFLHVDYEGGLVHLRHVMEGGPSIVLFGPTTEEQLNYRENIPVCTGACSGGCAWKYKDWFATCHNEEHPYICMKSITPEMVFEKVKEYLDGNVQG